KEVGPGRQLVVVRPSSASSLPPLPSGIDKLRRPARNLLDSVERERRALVRAMHASGYDGLPRVLATNLGTDGTVADALKPLKAKSASVFDVQFALRAMAYVRAYFRDQGIVLTAESAAA